MLFADLVCKLTRKRSDQSILLTLKKYNLKLYRKILTSGSERKDAPTFSSSESFSSSSSKLKWSGLIHIAEITDNIIIYVRDIFHIVVSKGIVGELAAC